MKVLVTGGAGFTGSNIVFDLVKRGFETYVVDAFHTGGEEDLEDASGSVRVFRCCAGDTHSLGIPKMDFQRTLSFR